MATLSELSNSSTKRPSGPAELEDADFGDEYRDFVRKVRLGFESVTPINKHKAEKKSGALNS